MVRARERALRVGSFGQDKPHQLGASFETYAAVETRFPDGDGVVRAAVPIAVLYKCCASPQFKGNAALKNGTAACVETWFPPSQAAADQRSARALSSALAQTPLARYTDQPANVQSLPSIQTSASTTSAFRTEPAFANALPRRCSLAAVKRGSATSENKFGALSKIAEPLVSSNRLRTDWDALETRFPHPSVSVRLSRGRCASSKLGATSAFSNPGSTSCALPSWRPTLPSPPFGASRSPLVETGFPRFRSPHHV